MPVDLALIEQLHEFETPAVAESLGALGCPETHRYYMGGHIKLLTGTPQPMVGVALTLEADTSSPNLKVDPTVLHDRGFSEVQSMTVPVVLVIKAVGSRPDHECVLGDGLAKLAKSVGVCGFVTNGGARDLAGVTAAGVTVFGSGPVVNHCTLVFSKPEGGVEVGGVHVHDGDLIHGDENGVHLIPEQFHHAIVEACCITRDYETRNHTHFRRTDKTLHDKHEFRARLSEKRMAMCKALMEGR